MFIIANGAACSRGTRRAQRIAMPKEAMMMSPGRIASLTSQSPFKALTGALNRRTQRCRQGVSSWVQSRNLGILPATNTQKPTSKTITHLLLAFFIIVRRKWSTQAPSAWEGGRVRPRKLAVVRLQLAGSMAASTMSKREVEGFLLCV